MKILFDKLKTLKEGEDIMENYQEQIRKLLEEQEQRKNELTELITKLERNQKEQVDLLDDSQKKLVIYLTEVSDLLNKALHIVKVMSMPSNNYIQQNVELQTAIDELDEMIGLNNVKEEIEKIAALVKEHGATNGPGHYAFVGNPGTGKTVVAQKIGKIFNAIGVLKTDKVIYTKKDDLVSGFIGQTSVKTREICKSALDGVLVIDDAHLLVNKEATGEKFSSKFDEEAYYEIMTFMEENRDRICVIFTGYEEGMNCFLEADPSMRYRINKIYFLDYTAEELFAIYRLMAKKDNMSLTSEHENKVLSYLNNKIENKTKEFSNARIARNLLKSCEKIMYGRLARKYGNNGDSASYAEKHILTENDFI